MLSVGKTSHRLTICLHRFSSNSFIFRWTVEKDTGHLIAYHLKKEDEGKYVCIAENNAGRIEVETFLVSSATPSITTFMLSAGFPLFCSCFLAPSGGM
jgi:hypothetical protein